MFPHQGAHHGQLPTHWQPPTGQQPTGSYPPPPAHLNSAHPSHQDHRPDMSGHQQPYRLPGPHEWSQQGPADPYRGQPPPPPNYMHQQHQPPAPRQRTAIACRYCRRRKIRCSGFEATDDGRCSNCMRFNQDCIFTPVSAQTQAFVPAHTVWRGVGQPPPMYGAYGQPLPPANHAEPYGGQQPPVQRGGPAYLPSPTGATAGPYPSTSSGHGPSAVAHDEAGGDAWAGRKRPHAEPHTPTLPRPNPGPASQLPHRGPGQDHALSDGSSLTSAASPANSSASYSSAPPANQPYYAAPPNRRGSPQSPYPYEGSRSSSSPHAQAPSTPGGGSYYPPPPGSGSLQPAPPRSDGTTPPPTSQPNNRPGMRINDLMSDSGPQRSSTDSNMLNMLNRRPM